MTSHTSHYSFPYLDETDPPDIAGGLSFMRGAERLPVSLNG